MENKYEKLHRLKKDIIYNILDTRNKLGVNKFNRLLEDKQLIRGLYYFTTETSGTNINTLLLALDKLGYDLVAIKRKDNK